MKLSVCVGVLQMLVGVFLKYFTKSKKKTYILIITTKMFCLNSFCEFVANKKWFDVFFRFGNSIHHRNWVDLFCECIPQLLFMVFFFGFMDFYIMYKWVNPVDTMPSIINSLICMGLSQPNKAPMYITFLTSSLHVHYIFNKFITKHFFIP